MKITANTIFAQDSSASRIERWLRELIIEDSPTAAATEGASIASNEMRVANDATANTSCFVESDGNV